MKIGSMKLNSYIVARDFGFTPNPFYGIWVPRKTSSAGYFEVPCGTCLLG